MDQTKADDAYNAVFRGEILRALRIHSGWSQTETAALMGLTQSALSRVEHGERSCPLSSALQFMRLFPGLDLIVLFEPVKPERPDLPPSVLAAFARYQALLRVHDWLGERPGIPTE